MERREQDELERPRAGGGMPWLLLLLAGCPGVAGLTGGATTMDAGPTDDAAIDTAAPLDSGKADSGVLDSGQADSATIVDSGCGDLQTNASNCGRCGHDCLGGACEAGVCQPFALTSTPMHPVQLAVDGTSVYWTQPFDGLVQKASKKDGSGVVTLMSYAQAPGRLSLPLHLALDTTAVYVSDPTTGYVLSCATSGCGGNPTTVGLMDGGLSPNFLAIGGSYVYWTDTTSSVWRANKSGGDALQLLATYSPLLDGGVNSTPAVIAVNSLGAYWTNDDGTVQTVGLDGGTPTRLGAGTQPASGGIAVSNGVVYFTQVIDPGSIDSVPAAGGPTSVIQGSQVSPHAITADSNDLYWANSGSMPTFDNGSVMMCPIANCTSPTVLASLQLAPNSIAVDSAAVYWTNQAIIVMPGQMGAVMKVAKP